MKIGFFIYNPDNGADPVTVAREAENLGLESMFVPEHSHIPLSRMSPYPSGAPLPPQYLRMRDPFVTLMAAAMVTKTLKLGPGICLVTEHHPIVLAKTVATLDELSGGRLLFGVGQGWNDEEMRNIGTDPRKKLAIMADRIAAMKEIWTKETPEYHGPYVDFDPIYCWPKPVQKPYPPIMVGGNGPTVLRRVVRYGDEWYPVHDDDFGRMKERIAELQELAAAAGRGPIPVTVTSCRLADLDRYAEIGVSRAVFGVPVGPTEETVGGLRELTQAASDYIARH